MTNPMLQVAEKLLPHLHQALLKEAPHSNGVLAATPFCSASSAPCRRWCASFHTNEKWMFLVRISPCGQRRSSKLLIFLVGPAEIGPAAWFAKSVEDLLPSINSIFDGMNGLIR